MLLPLRTSKIIANSVLAASVSVMCFSSVAFAQSDDRITALAERAADNVAKFPNIYRAFEENVDGIENVQRFDEAHRSGSGNGASQGDISRLPTIDRDPTLRGEFDAVSWPIYVTPTDVGSPVRVSLVFLNAASVMPENSTLELLVNGVKLSEKIIQNPTSPGTLVADIPANSLMAGYNAITVVGRQYHRVDCSADATFELWTRIDTERSTIEYLGNKQRIQSFADIGGVIADQQQAMPVRLHYPSTDPMTPWDNRSQAYFELAQQAAVVRGLRRKDVKIATFESTHAHESALDFFSGSIDELNATPTLARLYDLDTVADIVASADTNAVFVTSRGKRRTLVARLDEVAHLPDAFATARDAPVGGSPQGLILARMNKFDTFENDTVSLGELGYVEHEFAGRRFNATVGFRLPADFYPGSYDQIELHLFGLYTDGLSAGQKLLVSINGESEVSLPLSSKRGGVFDNKILELDLARFQPGFNEIEITAFLEKPVDQGCIPGSARDSEPRFFLSGDSFISVPRLAKLGRFPNAGATIGTGFPYRTSDERGSLDVVLADDRPRTMEKAVAFVSIMASEADHVFDIRPRLWSPVTEAGLSQNRLVVGNYSALPSTYASLVDGANIAELAGYWSNPDAALAQNNIDLISTGALGPSNQGAYGPAEGLAVDHVTDRFRRLPTGSNDENLREWFQRQALERRGKYVQPTGSQSQKTILGTPLPQRLTAGSHQTAIGNDAPAVLSQFVEGETVTTLVGYADQPGISASLSSFFEPGRYRDDLVQTAGLRFSDSRVTAVQAAGPQLSMITDYSVRNIRLIIAGWLSNNPAVFGALTLFLFLAAGWVSHMTLNRTRRSKGEAFDHLNM